MFAVDDEDADDVWAADVADNDYEDGDDCGNGKTDRTTLKMWCVWR